MDGYEWAMILDCIGANVFKKDLVTNLDHFNYICIAAVCNFLNIQQKKCTVKTTGLTIFQQNLNRFCKTTLTKLKCNLQFYFYSHSPYYNHKHWPEPSAAWLWAPWLNTSHMHHRRASESKRRRDWTHGRGGEQWPPCPGRTVCSTTPPQTPGTHTGSHDTGQRAQHTGSSGSCSTNAGSTCRWTCSSSSTALYSPHTLAHRKHRWRTTVKTDSCTSVSFQYNIVDLLSI